MKNLIFITILVLFSFQMQAQSKKQLKKQLNQEIEKIRTSKSVGNFFAFTDYVTTLPDDLMQEISVYEADSLPQISQFSLGSYYNRTWFGVASSLLRQ